MFVRQNELAREIARRANPPGNSGRWPLIAWGFDPGYAFAFCFLLIAGATSLLTGCSSSVSSGEFQRLASFPDGDRVPRVEVLGSLLRSLPRFDETPAIERFLYGPNTYGKTVLRNPQGMTLAGNRLLVCDQGHLDVVALDLATGKSTFWCDSNHRPRCPVALCTDEAGRVYVADTTLRSVLVYDATGRFVEELTPGQEADRRFRPAAVLIHRGVLYVGNIGEQRVEQFDARQGQWLEPLVPSGGQSLMAPAGLAITTDGTLLIADAIAGTVHRKAADGRWLEPIGRQGRGVGEFVRPKQICVTPGGLVLVGDAGRQSVLVFSQSGQYVTEIFGQDTTWPGWALPMGLLAVDDRQWKAATRTDSGSKTADGGQREVEKDAAEAGATGADYVIVSDSLGGDALTLLRIVTR